MRICFVADLRSPIATNWIRYFVDRGDEVHVVATRPVEPGRYPGITVYTVSGALSTSGGVVPTTESRDRQHQPHTVTAGIQRRVKGSRGVGAAVAIRDLIGPIEIRRHVSAVRQIIERVDPDLVHAMRIPFEGMLAARSTPAQIPLLISVWGNDFTLHAPKNPIIGRETRYALRRADALHADCDRDLRLARTWGFDPAKPATVAPGAGGIRSQIFSRGIASKGVRERWAIPTEARVLINPRGIRAYVRTANLLRAFPVVLRDVSDAFLVCTGTQGHLETEMLVRQLGIDKSVRLTPVLSQEEMAELFRVAELSVSPSVHDGTPNSLLEAMACGSFPVAGDIESIREWIEHDVNGLLCDPSDPTSIASSLVRALTRPDLREGARRHNECLIAKRADYPTVMKQMTHFYCQLAAKTRCDSGTRGARTMTERIDAALVAEDAQLVLGAIEKAKSVLSLTTGLPIATVIEVGSGTGAILEKLDEAGFGKEYVALEPSAPMLAYMTKHRSISRLTDSEAATLDTSRFRDSRFDLAILSHVLEHLEDPAALLSSVLQMAEYVVVEVPLDGNRMGNIRAALKTHVTGVPREDNASGHIQYFDESALDSLIRWCGGETVRTRTYVPTPQLHRLRQTGSLARRLYASTMLAGARVLGGERWARLYHGHYAVLARSRSPRTTDSQTRWNPVYYGHTRSMQGT